MKYESTILKRLIDTYGVVGNPRYISEIIKEFIVRGKERFPELFTYQADWLEHIDEFGLNPSYTVSYTGQSIYAPNTLERPVKSAILSGQTLVNVLDCSRWGEQEKITLTADGTAKRIDLGRNLPIKSNTKYLTIIPVYENTINHNFTIGGWGYFTDQPRITAANGTGIIKIIKTTKDVFSDNLFYLELWKENTSGQITFGKPMFIEYQDGMENWDIPYFVGMQSVQMPGLTTTGKNLYNDEGGLTNRDINSTTGIESGGNRFVPNAYTRVFGGEKYTLYRKLVKTNIGLRCYDINKRFINTYTPWSSENILIFNAPSNCYYVKFIDEYNSLDNEYAIYLGDYSSNFEYEPYKSNILTVNEDVTLRGIGDVKDELNLLTGELTQRIGGVILDGSEKWYGSAGNFRVNIPNVKGYKELKWGQKSAICNLYPSFEGVETDYYIISEWEGNQIRIHDIDTTLEELKSKLAKNPLHVIFISNEDSVKTVDLTILDQNGQNVKQLMSFNGGTHFNTRSSEGSPLPTVSISVETDLEETLKMCSLDGNTM